MESAALRKTVRAGETVERISYRAHCVKCHFRQEVDLVTKMSVKECKGGVGDFDLGQMVRLKSIIDQCFKGKKDLVCVTTQDALPNVERTIATSEHWRRRLAGGRGVRAEDP